MYETKQGLSDQRIGVHSFSRAIQEQLPLILNPIQRLSKLECFFQMEEQAGVFLSNGRSINSGFFLARG